MESFVRIPGWATLPEAKQRAIRIKLLYESRNIFRLLWPSYTNMTYFFFPKREQQIAPPLDVDALQKALRSVPLLCCPLPADTLHRDLPRQSLTPTPPPTPPPDHESDIAESLELEKQARKHLSEDGCPPCYPADLGFPLHDIPNMRKLFYTGDRSPELDLLGSSTPSIQIGRAFAATRKKSDAIIYTGKRSIFTCRRCATDFEGMDLNSIVA